MKGTIEMYTRMNVMLFSDDAVDEYDNPEPRSSNWKPLIDFIGIRSRYSKNESYQSGWTKEKKRIKNEGKEVEHKIKQIILK